MNNELNFPPTFERLVLGCVDAADSETRLISQHFSKSIRSDKICTLLHRSKFISFGTKSSTFKVKFPDFP